MPNERSLVRLGSLALQVNALQRFCDRYSPYPRDDGWPASGTGRCGELSSSVMPDIPLLVTGNLEHDWHSHPTARRGAMTEGRPIRRH